MKKFTKKVLPVILAGALVAGMAMPSMAATPTTTTTDSWKTDWITFNEAGDTITDIDWDGYLYYVAAGEVLKNAPAFTNQGTIEEGRNENNLFGQPKEQYGFNSELVWDLEKGGAEGTLHKAYGTWDKYWAENSELITKQANMTDSIAFLSGKAGDSTVAKYWMVRHGTNDRDTGFMNQTLLKLAMDKAKADGKITDTNFEFEFNRKHEGSYNITEAVNYLKKAAPIDAASTAADALAADTAAATLKITVKDKTVDVSRYTYDYLGAAAASYLTEAQLANAKVNIYVPAGAKADTPVFYLVDNSGWFNNSYTDKLVEDGKTYTDADGKSNLAAKALGEGYIVVDAGLRARQYIDKGPKSSVDAAGNYLHSPVTVADAKAVITFVKDKLNKENTKIVVSGTSGGGALSVVLGASGNSALYADELAKLGAVAGDNSVTGLIAYCPITDLGHSDGSYEYTYAGTRADLLAAGYTKDSSGFVLSDSTMAVSPKLALAYTTYVNGLGIAGTDNTFDTATLTASGTLAKEAKALVIAALNEGLDAYENNKTAFLAVVAERAVVDGYKVPVEPEKPTAPKTGNNMMPLFAVVVAAGAVALASTRRRVVR